MKRVAGSGGLLVARLTLGAVLAWAGLSLMLGRSEASPIDAAIVAAWEGEPAPGEAPALLTGVERAALAVERASRPAAAGAAGAPSEAPRAWWATRVGRVSMSPLAMGWTLAVTLLAGGALIALGLFSRLAGTCVSLALASAAWVGEVGEWAVAGAIPAREAWDLWGWSWPAGLATLAGVSLGLALSGPGRWSMDARMFDVPSDETKKA